jgi:hypothetical protein
MSKFPQDSEFQYAWQMTSKNDFLDSGINWDGEWFASFFLGYKLSHKRKSLELQLNRLSILMLKMLRLVLGPLAGIDVVGNTYH